MISYISISRYLVTEVIARCWFVISWVMPSSTNSQCSSECFFCAFLVLPSVFFSSCPFLWSLLQLLGQSQVIYLSRQWLNVYQHIRVKQRQYFSHEVILRLQRHTTIMLSYQEPAGSIIHIAATFISWWFCWFIIYLVAAISCVI